MHNKIAFIAIGQAGGNIGREFEKRGFQVLYINTSKEDLDTLKDAKHKYHIKGGEGCNKVRKKAKMLLSEDFDSIFEEIQQKLKAEMYFVVFSSGGGTGSGAGPMLIDLLLDEGKTVGAVTILPSKDDSLKAHINSYECFKELTAIEQMASCFIIDNDKTDKMTSNRVFADSFDRFVSIPEKFHSELGNIDTAEIMETLRTRGVAKVIARPQAGANYLDALKDNVFAQNEERAVKYITAVLPENAKMEDVIKEVGTPIDIFQTPGKSEFICCVAGLTYPQGRLNGIYDFVEQHKEDVLRNLSSSMKVQMKGDVNFVDDFETETVKSTDEGKPKSKRDLMKKYL